MKLTLTPDTVTSKSTISQLTVDEVFYCYVLEPPNPIPAGRYFIELLPSKRFNRLMPFLHNVPGHQNIEIHFGNTVADTRDCLLVGLTKSQDFVGESHAAFSPLFEKLTNNPGTYIEILRQVEKPVAVPAIPQPEKGVAQMADAPTTSSKLALTNHAPVTASLVAGAATSILIALAKAKFGLDLSGQEGNLVLLIGAAVGYLTKDEVT